jgi:4,4'-dithiodibutanoate disulfide reductase
VLRSIREAIDSEAALSSSSSPSCLIMVKMNLSDGVEAGLSLEESALIAIEFAKSGVDIIGLSGGLILENGLYMLRGEVPLHKMIAATSDTLKRIALALFGRILVPQFPFQERFFQDPALFVAKKIQEWKQCQAEGTGVGVKVCYMGGVHTLQSVRIVTEELGFDFLQSGRAILRDPEIVNRWADECFSSRRQDDGEMTTTVPSPVPRGENTLDSLCSKCNHCIVDATMRQRPIACVEW